MLSCFNEVERSALVPRTLKNEGNRSVRRLFPFRRFVQTNNACTSGGAAAFRQENNRQGAAGVERLPALLASNLTIRERSFRRIWGISN